MLFILTLLLSTLIQTHGQVTCASGWVGYKGKCYLLNPIIGTWMQCFDYCAKARPDATMLCVNNLDENAWINTGNGGREIWIGYFYTNQWVWVTGCSNPITNWDATQPNNGNDKYGFISTNTKWHDLTAEGTLSCGCQYIPVLTTAPTYSPSTVAASPSTVAPMTSSPSSVAPTTATPSKTTPSTTVPSRDGAFTCYWKFYSSQPSSVFQQDSLMTSSAVDSETVPEFDYFYYVVFASVALGSLLTLLIQASLYCCTRKAYAAAIADRSEYFPITGRE